MMFAALQPYLQESAWLQWRADALEQELAHLQSRHLSPPWGLFFKFLYKTPEDIKHILLVFVYIKNPRGY